MLKQKSIKFLNLPTLEYLKFGNIFSGSFEGVNYKLFPKIEENCVRVVIFKGEFSFEECEDFKEKTFEIKKNLIEEIKLWFELEYENLK